MLARCESTALDDLPSFLRSILICSRRWRRCVGHGRRGEGQPVEEAGRKERSPHDALHMIHLDGDPPALAQNATHRDHPDPGCIDATQDPEVEHQKVDERFAQVVDPRFDGDGAVVSELAAKHQAMGPLDGRPDRHRRGGVPARAGLDPPAARGPLEASTVTSPRRLLPLSVGGLCCFICDGAREVFPPRPRLVLRRHRTLLLLENCQRFGDPLRTAPDRASARPVENQLESSGASHTRAGQRHGGSFQLRPRWRRRDSSRGPMPTASAHISASSSAPSRSASSHANGPTPPTRVPACNWPMADENPFGRLEVPIVTATGSAAGTSSNRSDAASIASRWATVVARAPEATLAERASGLLDRTGAGTPPGPLGGPRRFAALPVARPRAGRLAGEVATALVVVAGARAGAGVADGVTGVADGVTGAGAGDAGDGFRVTWPSGCGGGGGEGRSGGSPAEGFGGC